MTSLSIPRVFRRNRDTKDQNVEINQVVNVQDSKIRHLLGITDAELKRARRQSVSSTSTTRLHSVSFSEATTVPVSTSLDIDQITGRERLPHLKTRASSVLLREDDHKSLSATPNNTQLRSHASSSTLQSYYDSQRAPLSISQQTSNSSSRDFALRKGSASVISLRSKETEHARQLLFFKTSKTRLKDKRKVTDSGVEPEEGTSLDNQGYHARNIPRSSRNIPTPLPAIGSTSISSPPLKSGRKLFPQRKPIDRQKIITAFTGPVNDTPFAKINVRRPKVGARHWFDDVEGDTSGDESHGEPELEQKFVAEVQRASADGDFNASHDVKTAEPGLPHSSLQTSIKTTRWRPDSCRVIIPHGPEMAEIPARNECQRQQLTTRSSSRRISVCSPGRNNILAAADLSKESILSLSSSDDEEDDKFKGLGHRDMEEKEKPVQRTQSLKRDPSIRDSLALSTMDDTDIEIGLAHTIKTRHGTPIIRPPRIHGGLTASTKRLVLPGSVPQRVDTYNSSCQPVAAHKKEISESEIITSFPPTPSESGSRRKSTRTPPANLSDDTTTISTRLMQVTKQEERLLAAMRSKRAAMLDADRETERKSTLRMLESGSERNMSPNNILRNPANDSTKLVGYLSHEPNPLRTYVHRCSSGGDANTDQRDSGTTFQTTSSTYSRRESQATFRSNLSDDSQVPYSAYSQFSQRNTIPTSLRLLNQSRQRESAARNTFLSIASDATSRHRDSHIVMLDGLDEMLDRETIPSQLFMEKPFLGWERAGLTAAY